ncbi:MAG: sigma 54-interacting transcriptional regulator [Bacteroidota bacterium]|nr:sigma 54-interacting transcriptional regulator [Bacteroidota bacterium]
MVESDHDLFFPRSVLDEARRVAEWNCGKSAPDTFNILILGESGTGKERLARFIHDESVKHDKGGGKFQVIHCAGLPSSLLQAELFGHVKGAFTGAVKDRKGLMAEAEGGTLFLDEIGDIRLEDQAVLLRVIQKRVYTPVGSNVPKTLDARIITATNRDLPRDVKEGRFREDLFYRIQQFTLRLPPLRETPDILERMVDKLSRNFGYTLTEGAKRIALTYGWPGNKRELEHALRLFRLYQQDGRVGENILRMYCERHNTLPQDSSPRGTVPAGFVLPDWLRKREREWVELAMEQAGGIQRKAASLLGVSPQNLSNRLRSLGLR